MGSVTNKECNAILVIIVHWFLPLIGGYLATSMLMKMPGRSLGTLVWTFIPILNLIVMIDNILVAFKLQNGETLDEFHHELGFLSALPLLHE